MHITSFPTQLFLDSGDPRDTAKALQLLGKLDGQTTNPSLVAKNPEVQKKIASGKTFDNASLLSLYESIIKDISRQIPHGSVSIEVYADHTTTAHELLDQASTMYQWIPNAHIKFPTNMAGLEAAHKFAAIGGRVNMTLGFTLAQAIAVQQATRGASIGQVFYSSFVGRVFDSGTNGIELLRHVVARLNKSHSHVQVLAASFRSLDQLKGAIVVGSDIVTIPLNLIEEWSESAFELSPNYQFTDPTVSTYSPESISDSFNWRHDLEIPEQALTGVEKFAQDWNGLLS
jgi:transaldolase